VTEAPDSLSSLTFLATSAERLNTLSEHVTERRRELLEIMARRRRARLATQRNSGEGIENPIPATSVSEPQTEPDNDDDSGMQFSIPEDTSSENRLYSAQPASLPNRPRGSFRASARLSQFPEGANRDTVLEMERRHRNRTVADEQLPQREDESSRRGGRVGSSSSSRQRREYVFSHGWRLRTPPAASASASPESRSTDAPDSNSALETGMEDEVRRTLALAQAIFRRQRLREIETRVENRSSGSVGVTL
jgi:hypothetical protein